jgi:hypothetical protein
VVWCSRVGISLDADQQQWPVVYSSTVLIVISSPNIWARAAVVVGPVPDPAQRVGDRDLLRHSITVMS